MKELLLFIAVLPLLGSAQAASDAKFLYTDAELYLRDAWRDVGLAEIGGPSADKYWKRAIGTVTLMLSEHKDWPDIAKRQNEAAHRAPEKFPMTGLTNLTPTQVAPLFEKYWALYHVGAAEFILVMGNAALRDSARQKGDRGAADVYDLNAREAARRILLHYNAAQIYDEKGWLWQPADALHEHVEISSK